MAEATGLRTGLRERKKLQTRRAISDIATRLFLRDGFDAVTISRVAAAAGVAKMTVTNYFPRKEDLIFDQAGVIVARAAEAVSGRRAGESLLAAMRRDYAAAAARQDPALGLSQPGFAAMIMGSPVLASRAMEISYQRERAIGDAIAAETGQDTPEQRIVAAQLASVHRVLAGEATRRSLAGESRERITTFLSEESERAFDRLEPALGDYLVRPA